MPPRKRANASLKVHPWSEDIKHKQMPDWERVELRNFCALVGVHGGLVEWPCPDAEERG